MIELTALTIDHLQEAADLFTATYQQCRASIPLLPSRYAESDLIKTLLQELVLSNPAIAAFSQGRLVGYLAGFPIPNFNGEMPGVYCPEWAHAVCSQDKVFIYQTLLKALSRQWVAQGYTTHSITFLAQDEELRESLFWNGFGLLVVDALRGVGPVALGVPVDTELRMATGRDWNTIFTFERALNELLAQAPIFRHAEPVQEFEVQQALADADCQFWIIAQDHRPAGYLSAKRHNTDACQIIQDEATLSIVGAYVRPELRKSGLGQQLLNAALLWAQEAQFARCAVDFESQNLEAGSFWLQYFTPVCYSVMRKIDERLVV